MWRDNLGKMVGLEFAVATKVAKRVQILSPVMAVDPLSPNSEYHKRLGIYESHISKLRIKT